MKAADVLPTYAGCEALGCGGTPVGAQTVTALLLQGTWTTVQPGSSWKTLRAFSLVRASSPSTTGPPPRPHTAPQTGSRSLGSSGLKSPWPPASSLRCFSEISDKRRKDVTLFTVCVVRRFNALNGGGQRRLPLVLHCHLVSVKIAPSLLFLIESRQKLQLNGIKWALQPK